MFSLTSLTQARAQGHSSQQQAALQGSVPLSPRSSVSNGPTARPPPPPTYGRKMQGHQKFTLKKSLFKKVLAARTVTKQKERRTNKTRRRLCPVGRAPASVELLVPREHDAAHGVPVGLVGLSLAGSPGSARAGPPRPAFGLCERGKQ